MKYVFGPVFSRRLGMSLGVDPIPMKTCNWNCVYCQLGRTMPLTNERKDYFPAQEILDEVKQVLSSKPVPQIDWISIVGSGEPLLVKSLGYLIREIKKLTSIPVALITNGSLFYLPEVRHDVLAADAILPSIDAGSAEIYRKMNRPHAQVPFDKFIDGLTQLRQEYQGKFWPEVMLVKGINDSKTALEDIAVILKKLRPDMVHLNMPVRPPAEKDVSSSGEEVLAYAADLIGKAAQIARPAVGVNPVRHNKITAADIIAMVSRHPASEEEIAGLLQSLGQEGSRKIVEELQKDKTVKLVTRNGIKYWCSALAFFPEK